MKIMNEEKAELTSSVIIVAVAEWEAESEAMKEEWDRV